MLLTTASNRYSYSYYEYYTNGFCYHYYLVSVSPVLLTYIVYCTSWNTYSVLRMDHPCAAEPTIPSGIAMYSALLIISHETTIWPAALWGTMSPYPKMDDKQVMIGNIHNNIINNTRRPLYGNGPGVCEYFVYGYIVV